MVEVGVCVIWEFGIIVASMLRSIADLEPVRGVDCTDDAGDLAGIKRRVLTVGRDDCAGVLSVRPSPNASFET